MKDNDKILINSYLEDEITIEESNYVEELLKKDKEAQEYLNALKKTNIEINNFFNSSEISEINKNISEFIVSKKVNKNHLFSNINLFFKPQPIAGYALTALLTLFISTNFIDLNNLDISDFNEVGFSTEIPVTRSVNSQPNEIELIVKRMLTDRIISADINLNLIDEESTQLTIKVLEKIYNNDIECFVIEFYSKKDSVEKIACISDNNFFIHEIN